MKKILIVGAGFSGSVVAERLAANIDCEITILEERGHVGGNCYTEVDESTGIIVHKYGPHIFNTNNEKVWDYINQFTKMIPFINRVKSVVNGQVYSMPINLHTINQFFQKTMSPKEAKSFIDSKGDFEIASPTNFEEQALKFIGEELYMAFFYGYTKKQWGCEPAELPASILKRLPVRFDYNDNYYTSKFQGIPENGYTEIFDKMLQDSKIDVKLNTKFDKDTDIELFDYVVYTGPIDAYFDYRFGRLGYRTVYFEKSYDTEDFQGNAVINYPDSKIPYTRIHEHKHFMPWKSYEKTVYFKEFSKETESDDVPYYPKRLAKDIDMLQLYEEEAKKISNKVIFLGRLANYQYKDMHHIIADALDCSESLINKIRK